jgi:hypothetical protein
MQPSLDVRRNSDGSIDFDFYRRRARRRRRLARRMLVRHRLTAAGRLVSSCVSMIAHALVILWPERDADASVPAATLRANGRQ